MPTVDLNADVGEGAPTDLELIRYVTSVNIACGAHAGDEKTMRSTVRAAMSAGVAIGAHPGYEDRESLGRREMHLSEERVVGLVTRQLETLDRIAGEEGAALVHVKPHGALYNQAAFDSALAEAIVEAVHRYDPGLLLVGLAGSELVAAGRRAGLRVANEGFADRNYRPDGSLIPRREPEALIGAPDEAAGRALKMVKDGVVLTPGGREVELEIDTICIHGDSPGAVELAAAVRAALGQAGIDLRPLGS